MYHHHFRRREPRPSAVTKLQRYIGYVRRRGNEPCNHVTSVTHVTCLLCVIVALVLVAVACAHSAVGLRREQAASELASNTVAAATQLVPYVPAPAQPLVELLIALATAGLTA